jgi:hypothetical protein
MAPVDVQMDGLEIAVIKVNVAVLIIAQVMERVVPMGNATVLLDSLVLLVKSTLLMIVLKIAMEWEFVRRAFLLHLFKALALATQIPMQPVLNVRQ